MFLSKRITYYTGDETKMLHSGGHIGYHDYVRYAKDLSPNFKKVLLNHGDLASSLLIFTLLEESGIKRNNFAILRDGQSELI